MSAGRVLFSHRYGIADVMAISRWCSAGGSELSAGDVWRFRHSPEVTAWDEREPLFRCACPGSTLRRADPVPGCRQRASQEDRLCDACREHCWAVDAAGIYHRLMAVYGPAT